MLIVRGNKNCIVNAIFHFSAFAKFTALVLHRGGVQLNLTQFKITIFKLSLGNSWVKIE